MYYFLTQPNEYCSHGTPGPIRRLFRKLLNIALAGLLTFSVVGSAACAINLFR